MSDNGERETGMKKIWKVLEWAAIAAVMHYCICLFLTNSSTFRIPFVFLHRKIMFGSVVALGVLRFGWGSIRELVERKDRRDVPRVLLRGVLTGAAVVLCTLITKKFDYTFMVYLPFVAMCLYRIEAEKVLKVFTAVLGTMLAVTVLCALSGAIRNLLYLRGITWGQMRSSYGICYPTDLAAYLVYFLVLLFACMRKESRGQSVLLLLLVLGTVAVIAVYIDARNSLICAALIALVVLYDRLSEDVLSGRKGTKWIRKTVDGLTIASFPLLGAVMLGLSWLYGQGNGLAVKINGMLSDRLSLTWTSLNQYGIRLFGALTPQTGWGGRLVNTEGYEFLDSTYALLLIRYGIFFTILVGCLWVWMTRKAIRTGHRRIALAMALIAFHSFMEHHFPELNYNILLVMPLCLFGKGSETAESPAAVKPPADGRKAAAGWIAGAVVAAGFVLLLPKMLSLARCLFAMKGWQNILDWYWDGYETLGAMVCWLVCLAAWVGLWFALRRGIAELLAKKRLSWRAPAGLAAATVVFVGGFLLVRGQIAAGQGPYAEQMEKEAAAVEQVLAAAEQPVYAGQMEELYKRRFNGISDRIFTPEELARSCKGSILLEHDNEAYQLLNTGAKYTELSPSMGLFTYDEAVIAKLSEAGYAFHDYYSAEREVKLSTYRWNEPEPTEYDALNLPANWRLVLRGPFEEQYAGSYTVTYKLKLKDSDLIGQDQEVCVLRAVTQYGDVEMTSRIVKANEFDQKGNLTVEMNYRTGTTRGVEYRVYVIDGAQVGVRKVSWKQTSR